METRAGQFRSTVEELLGYSHPFVLYKFSRLLLLLLAVGAQEIVTKMLDGITNDSVTIVKPDDEFKEYKDRWEPYTVPVFFGIIFLVGVIGNGSLVYILCRHKTMRSVPNTFIFNLALGDLLILVFTVPFVSIIYTVDSWPFGEFICKASEFAKVLI